MKKSTFILLLILFFTGASKILSCGGDMSRAGYEWSSRTEPTLFEYSVVNDTLFYYTYPNLNLYSNPAFNNAYDYSTSQILEGVFSEKQMSVNLEEWHTYFNGSISLSNLKSILYTGSSQMELPIKDTNASEYIRFLVQISLSVIRPEYWSYSTDEKKILATRKNFCKIAIEKAESSSLPFFKARYGYQAVRLAELTGNHKQAIECFDRYVATQQYGTYPYYSALGYKARALWITSRTSEALQLYRILFDQSPPHLLMVMFSIPAIDPTEKDWTKCINDSKNNHIKESFWFLRELTEGRSDNMEALQRMIDLDPRSSHNEIVMLRKILEIESSYLTSKNNAISIPLEMARFCDSTSETKGIRVPEFWILSAAYLRFLAKDYNHSLNSLDKIINMPIKNQRILEQAQLIRTLISLQTSTDPDQKKIQTELIRSLNWSKKLNRIYSNWKIHDSIMVLLGDKFLQTGDRSRAVLSYFSAGSSDYNFFYETAKDIDFSRIIDLLKKSSPQPIDDLIIAKFPHSQNDIIYFRGLKSVENEQYQKAINILSTLPENFWKSQKKAVIDGDQFHDHRYDTKCKIKLSLKSPDPMIKTSTLPVKYFNSNIHYYYAYPNLFIDISLLEYARTLLNLSTQTGKEKGLSANAYYTLGNLYFSILTPELVMPLYSRSQLRNKALFYYLKTAGSTDDVTLAFKATVMFGLISKNLDKGYDKKVAIWCKDDRQVLKNLYSKLKNEKIMMDYRSYCPGLKELEK